MRAVKAADDLVKILQDAWPGGYREDDINIPRIMNDNDTMMDGRNNRDYHAIYVKAINESKERFPTSPTESYGTIRLVLEVMRHSRDGRRKYLTTVYKLDKVLRQSLRPPGYLELNPGQYQDLPEDRAEKNGGNVGFWVYRGIWPVDIFYYDRQAPLLAFDTVKVTIPTVTDTQTPPP